MLLISSTLQASSGYQHRFGPRPHLRDSFGDVQHPQTINDTLSHTTQHRQSPTLARRQERQAPPPALQYLSGGAGHNSLHAKALITASAEIHCLAYLSRLFKPP